MPSNQDLNALTTYGKYKFYGLGTSITNKPSDMINEAGVIEVLPGCDGGWRKQIITTNSGQIFERSFSVSSTDAATWQRIDNYGTTTLSGLASALGVDKYFKVKTGSGNSGINSNAGYYGCTLIAIVSLHASSGNNTYSQIDMIRCGYNDNHIEVVNISKSTGGIASVISYSLDSDGFIQVSSNNNPQTLRVLFIANRAI